MAKLWDIEQLIARETGIPFLAVRHYSRRLLDAGLLPKPERSRRGRQGRDAPTLHSEHAAALAIALCDPAGPIEGPRLVEYAKASVLFGGGLTTPKGRNLNLSQFNFGTAAFFGSLFEHVVMLVGAARIGQLNMAGGSLVCDRRPGLPALFNVELSPQEGVFKSCRLRLLFLPELPEAEKAALARSVQDFDAYRASVTVPLHLIARISELLSKPSDDELAGIRQRIDLWQTSAAEVTALHGQQKGLPGAHRIADNHVEFVLSDGRVVPVPKTASFAEMEDIFEAAGAFSKSTEGT